MIFSRFRWDKDRYLALSKPSSAYIYYRKTRMNLLTGWAEVYSFQSFLDSLEELSLQDEFKKPRVYHFSYEYGLVTQGLGHTVGEDVPLVVEIQYEKKSFNSIPTKTRLENIKLKCLERPSWSEYKRAFERVQEHLLSGQGYQVNLTYPFDFETEENLDPRDVMDFFFSRRGIGAYAHATYYGDEMILSNSPECLFHYENNKLLTMPIKGTLKREGSFASDWSKLKNDEKERGELIMIADLLRNDLNRLDMPVAKVEKLCAPLRVTGLLHQYALLSVEIKNRVSFYKVLESLFPGGSITGAPKKRVMEILQEVERFQRGHYTGSTLLCIGKKKIASINIRTAQVSLGERLWRYAAGGGITLLSRPVFEFQEMENKVSSFLTLLKAPGYFRKE